MDYPIEQLVRDLAIGVLALRVFGPGAVALLRRLAAAGVRVGVSEMHRPTGKPGEGERR
ncbi:hypothetical protein ACWGJ2_19760 [Streptomyces sp. NPDC054796]